MSTESVAWSRMPGEPEVPTKKLKSEEARRLDASGVCDRGVLIAKGPGDEADVITLSHHLQTETWQ